MWQLDMRAGSVASLTYAGTFGMPLPKASSRITCMTHERLAEGLILIAGIVPQSPSFQSQQSVPLLILTLLPVLM